MRRIITFTVICILLNGCTASRKSVELSLTKESYCSPPDNSTWIDYPISHNIDSVLANNPELRKKFSVPSILLIHALGISDDVKHLNEDTYVRMQHIHDKVLLANSEINAITAELDCEGERMDQIARYIEDINSKRTTRLTVASIVAGALSGVAGAFITNSGWNKGVAIGGGVAAIGLGLATLNPKGRKIELLHKRNLLRNVWQEQNNHDISPFLWFMLTEKRISNSGTTSLLASLRHRWIRYQFDGDSSQAAASVNFTDGGTYLADDLHARAAMFNQLQAEIRSLDQYINTFLREQQ